MKEQQFTELGKSYWNSDGIYNEEYSKLYDELVPDQGEAETLNGELIRSISRLGHEYNNNGNGNAKDIETTIHEEDCCYCHGQGEVESSDENDDYEMEDCDMCGGTGYIEEEENEEPTITEFWKSFLDFIETNVPDTSTDCMIIEAVICQNDCSFSDEEENKYDKLFDKVIYYVLNNDNKPLN